MMGGLRGAALGPGVVWTVDLYRGGAKVAGASRLGRRGRWRGVATFQQNPVGYIPRQRSLLQ